METNATHGNRPYFKTPYTQLSLNYRHEEMVGAFTAHTIKVLCNRTSYPKLVEAMVFHVNTVDREENDRREKGE